MRVVWMNKKHLVIKKKANNFQFHSRSSLKTESEYIRLFPTFYVLAIDSVFYSFGTSLVERKFALY